MRPWQLRLSFLPLLLSSAAVLAANLPDYDLGNERPPVQGVTQGRGAVPAAVVSSRETQRGVPNLLLAQPGEHLPRGLLGRPEAAARYWLERYAGHYGLDQASLASARVRFVHDVGRGGIIVVFQQWVEGVELLRTEAKVLMTRELELVAIGGNLHPAAATGSSRIWGARRLGEAEAIAAALEEHFGVSLPASAFVPREAPRGGYQFFGLASPGLDRDNGFVLEQSVRVRPVLFPTPEAVIRGYYLELWTEDLVDGEEGLTAYVVGAEDGELLFRQRLTESVAYQYTVWAEADGVMAPLPGPQEDWAPHPTGYPDGKNPPFIAPVKVSVDGMNTNPEGGFDPWLAPDAVESRGNNVWAYTDWLADELTTDDLWATPTGPYTFDRVYNVTLEPLSSQDQSRAAVTQLFYTVNWLHDWYYDSGFTEPAGNAQASNYGRGGVENDPLNAQAQDSAQTNTRNNANMSIPADGSSPRMQMFLWSPETEISVKIAELGQVFQAGTAEFGPQEFNLTGVVVLANDGTGTPTDACEVLPVSVKGKIALIDRGTCDFQTKTMNAQKGGATGVLIVDNVDAATPFGMAQSTKPDQVKIPALSITLSDGTQVKTLLAAGTKPNGTLYRKPGPERDGEIDGTVVTHEWGHYLHRRLTYCSSTQCSALSEGFSDFVTNHLQYREGDALDGVYSMAKYAYAYSGDSAYYGIRRAPYSTDFTKNAFTFRHIQKGEPLPTEAPLAFSGGNNAESHNSGEIWAEMMWEQYMSLVGESVGSSPRLTFADVQRRMSDYLVAGMILSPTNATFTEMRDALLAAAAANDKQDMLAMAAGFAHRGAGSCAVSPPAASEDLVGVVESYELAPVISLDDVVVTEVASESCDEDGYVDAGEGGLLTFQVSNAGVIDLENTLVTVSASDPGVRFNGGTSLTLPALAWRELTTQSLPFSLSPEVTGVRFVDFKVSLSNPLAACSPVVEKVASVRVNFDDLPATSATERVESEGVFEGVWSTLEQGTGPGSWERAALTSTNYGFHGVDTASLTDSSLISPPLTAAKDKDLLLSFSHRFEFEVGATVEGGKVYNWDGGVIEVAVAGAEPQWVDISTYALPGYTGMIGDSPRAESNPLDNRQGYVGKNPSWPAFDVVKLNLGKVFAGQKVMFRFRIGTDEAVGANGWELDELAFQGVLETPFATLVEDTVSTWYADGDGDTFGWTEAVVLACEAPVGYVDNDLDCDDTDPSSYPGADEPGTDGIDHNCDGQVEQLTPTPTPETPTPDVTPTLEPTQAVTDTPEVDTPTPDPTPTPWIVETETPVVTDTPDLTDTPEVTPTPGLETETPAVTETPAPTATPEVTPTATPTATPEVTPTSTPEATPTAAPEVTPTAGPEATATAEPEATPTETPAGTPTATPDDPAATPTPPGEEPASCSCNSSHSQGGMGSSSLLMLAGLGAFWARRRRVSRG